MKKSKLPLSVALRRNLRAIKLLWAMDPGAVLAPVLSAMLAALRPYVTVWFSARLVAELAGARDPRLLALDAALILGSAALLGLAQSVLDRWKEREGNLSWFYSEEIFAKKFMDMDFVDADSQRIYDLYTRIRQTQNFQGYGFYYLRFLLVNLPAALVRILAGVGLTVGLFTARVPAGPLAVLNSPLFAGLFIALMLGAAWLASRLTKKAMAYFTGANDLGRFGNRVFGFFGYMNTEPKRAPDLRIYRQQENVCDPMMVKYMGFGVKSAFAKLARGPMGLLSALSEGVSALLVGVVYLFVCAKAWAGAFGLGAVTQYIGASTNLFQGVAELLKGLESLRTNGAFLELVEELLDTPNGMYQGSLTTEKRSDRCYEVEFRDVSFRYPGSEDYALRHVNMKFQVGRRLAVVGQNGSGKTTFIKLLCRLYDPTEGQILLNGIDIRKYRYDEYMDLFSVVFQDFQLFALPLGQNVAARREYDRDRAALCLEQAGFGPRLASMSQGLETYLYKELDEAGVEVSGGEAQKIAIARALYKDAPFIVLDEPTAALDPLAEAEIYGKFNEIAGDKTAIYISHRLSSCKFCDTIAVFEGGRVVQQGTHESLLADPAGQYAALWNAQAQYYTEQPA